MLSEFVVLCKLSYCILSIAAAVNVQHISIFGTCADMLHFAQHHYGVTVNSYTGKLTLHTDAHASVWREGRTVLGATSNLLYSEVTVLENVRSTTHVHKQTAA